MILTMYYFLYQKHPTIYSTVITSHPTSIIKTTKPQEKNDVITHVFPNETDDYDKLEKVEYVKQRTNLLPPGSGNINFIEKKMEPITHQKIENEPKTAAQLSKRTR